MEKLTKPQKAFYENLLMIRENVRSYGSAKKFAECMGILKGDYLYYHYHDMFHKIVNLGILTIATIHGKNRLLIKNLAEKGYVKIVDNMSSYKITIKLLEEKEND